MCCLCSVVDLKLNGQGYAPVYTSSPVFGPNYPTVECDSIPPAVECQDGPPLVGAPPSFPTRRPSGGTEGGWAATRGSLHYKDHVQISKIIDKKLGGVSKTRKSKSSYIFTCK